MGRGRGMGLEEVGMRDWGGRGATEKEMGSRRERVEGREGDEV